MAIYFRVAANTTCNRAHRQRKRRRAATLATDLRVYRRPRISINMELSICGRRMGVGPNKAKLLLAAVGAVFICFQDTCDAQIEVDAYIPDLALGRVYTVNTDNNALIGSPITVGPPIQSTVPAAPIGAAVTPDGRYVVVSNNNNNTVSIIDSVSRTVVDSLNVAPERPVCLCRGQQRP
jgi:YVTN family beta-propeller protein